MIKLQARWQCDDCLFDKMCVVKGPTVKVVRRKLEITYGESDHSKLGHVVVLTWGPAK